MLSEVKSEYVEFSRPPYAVDPLDEKLVKQARLGGVSCRLLIDQFGRAYRTCKNLYLALPISWGSAPSQLCTIAP